MQASRDTINRHRARCREAKPFLRILFRNAIAQSNSLYPLLILYCTIVRSGGCWRASAEEKWLQHRYRSGAAVDLQCEAILSGPFYCCVAGIIPLAHQNGSWRDLKQASLVLQVTLPVADR